MTTHATAHTHLESRFGGRFVSWRLVGRGGEGELYVVRDAWRGEEVALKLPWRAQSNR